MLFTVVGALFRRTWRFLSSPLRRKTLLNEKLKHTQKLRIPLVELFSQPMKLPVLKMSDNPRPRDLLISRGE